MKKCYLHAMALGLLLLFAPAAWGQIIPGPDTEVETEKSAQTGMKFLAMSVDARSAALGGAMMAEFNGSSASLFYNPASMAGMEGSFHASVGQLQFITDINYNVASLAYRPSGGNYGVVGVSLMSVDYGDFIGTVRADNDQGYLETGTFSPTALAVGLGYARSFSDRFSAGGQVKYALQDLGTFFTSRPETNDGISLVGASTEDYNISTVAFDFGVTYKTGFKSLELGIGARNFARELTYVRERFELPLTFEIGVGMNLMDLTSLDPNTHALQLRVDAQRPRDFNEHIRFGLEYAFQDMIYLRGGFEQLGVSEEQGASFGAGVKLGISNIRFGADYAYTDFGLFGNVNRLALQFGL
jgi:hypothetical protein